MRQSPSNQIPKKTSPDASEGGHDALTDEELLTKLTSKDSNEVFTAYDAKRLIEGGEDFAVAHRLEKFTGIDQNEMARLIIAKSGSVRSITNNLDKFININTDTARLMIETGMDPIIFVDHIFKFINLDQSEIVRLAIEKGRSNKVISNLDEFTGLDASIAPLLIKQDGSHAVARNLDKFANLDHNEIAHLMIEKGRPGAVADYLDKFIGIDHNEIARLITGKVVHSLLSKTSASSLASTKTRLHS